jgi:hypothetical protein
MKKSKKSTWRASKKGLLMRIPKAIQIKVWKLAHLKAQHFHDGA